MDYSKLKKIAPNAFEDEGTKEIFLNTNEFSDFFTYPIGLFTPLPRNENEEIKALLHSPEAMRLLEIKLGARPNSLKFRDLEKAFEMIDYHLPAETRGRPRLSLADCLFRWAVCVIFHGKKASANALDIDIKELKKSLRYLDEYAIFLEPFKSVYKDWDNLIPSTKDPISEYEKDIINFSHHLASTFIMKFSPSIEAVGKITEEHSSITTWEAQPVGERHQLVISADTKGWHHKVTELIDIMNSYSKYSRDERKNKQAQYNSRDN